MSLLDVVLVVSISLGCLVLMLATLAAVMGDDL